MTLLIWFRGIRDIALYYSFVAFLVPFDGPRESLACILLPAFLYALSHLTGRRRFLRVLLIAAAAVCLFLPGLSAAGRAAFLPVLIYTGYMIWTERCSLTHEQQEDILRLYLRAYPVFFTVIALCGGLQRLIAQSLFPAFLTAVISVFLLRTLRHEPEVYLGRRYLARSLSAAAAFVCAAWILHLRAVTHALTAAALAVYNHIIVPLLTAILSLVAMLLSIVLTPLLQLTPDSGTSLQLNSMSLEELIGSDSSYHNGSSLSAQVIWALLIIAAAAGCILLLMYLFRFLAGSRTGAPADGADSGEFRHAPDHSPASVRPRPLPPLHPASQVRRQYRRYLRLCGVRGFTPDACQTSRDIQDNTAYLFGKDEHAARELRELYITARYHGTASRADAVRAAQLVTQLQKSLSLRF